MEHVIHEIPPLFSPSSSILILGSFPSVKSKNVVSFTVIHQLDSGKYFPACSGKTCLFPFPRNNSFCFVTTLPSGMSLLPAKSTAPVTAALKMHFPTICPSSSPMPVSANLLQRYDFLETVSEVYETAICCGCCKTALHKPC